MKFIVTISDEQARDLTERADATHFTRAQLVGGAIADRLTRTPVDVEEVKE